MGFQRAYQIGTAMSKNRMGMILVDKWNCDACGCQNDPETDRCNRCRADTDGEVPNEEEFEGVEQ